MSIIPQKEKCLASFRPEIPTPDPANEHGMPAIWRFPTMGVPQNGWFVVENPIKMDD